MAADKLVRLNKDNFKGRAREDFNYIQGLENWWKASLY